jgi:hypothetical protein
MTDQKIDIAELACDHPLSQVQQCRHKAPPIPDLQWNASFLCCVRRLAYLLTRKPAGFLAQDRHSSIDRLSDQLDMKCAGSCHNDTIQPPCAQHGRKIGMNRNIWST